MIKDRRGVEIILVIIMGALLLFIFTAALSYIHGDQILTRRTINRELSFNIAEAGINYYRWHLAHAPTDYVDGGQVNISSISREGYELDYLTVGGQYYSDDTHTILSVPSSIDNLLWIKTKNSDTNNSSESFLKFTVNRPVYVYIAYDNRGTPPNWLTGNYTNTGEVVEVSDAAASPLHLWRRQLNVGEITLGGNLASGASGAESMYAISVISAPGNGPFIHDYVDFDGNVIGQYSLTVSPPSIGSTITTITSTGYSLSDTSRKRTIIARFGVPSFSQYSVIAADVMRFGEGTETFGRIHSNYGIRFDGVAHGLITSACTSYNDPDHSGADEDCVHTHQPNPDNVFLGGREFPVAPIDFNNITGDIAQMKIDAQTSDGVYLAPSGREGYHIVLKTNGLMDMFRVDSQLYCRYRPGGTWYSYANIYSIATEVPFTFRGASSLNVPFPNNGIIFVEDNFWVNGQIDGAKLTLVAGREPLASGDASIIINNDLRYSHYDSTDVIGLIAQKDISVGFYSEDDLRIDAAVIAQRGRAGRYYYQDFNLAPNRYNPINCGGNLPDGYIQRTTLTLYGSIATNQRYGFAYTDNTGYINRNLIFDEHLVFNPPPSFPTTGEYIMISWEEA